ncbi:hypothetical protein AB0F11_24495 [Streptomyces sp. NPDC032472]
MTKGTQRENAGQKGKSVVIAAAIGGFFTGLGRAITEWVIATFASHS